MFFANEYIFIINLDVFYRVLIAPLNIAFNNYRFQYLLTYIIYDHAHI